MSEPIVEDGYWSDHQIHDYGDWVNPVEERWYTVHFGDGGFQWAVFTQLPNQPRMLDSGWPERHSITFPWPTLISPPEAEQ